MVFSSATFILAFLPVFLILYYLIPTRPLKNIVLLVASLIFYAWGEPVYIGLMIISIAANWFTTWMLEGCEFGGRKFLLAFDLLINLCILGFFKYEGFLADNLNLILGAGTIPNLDLPLPIGISFYTLQAVSYVVDVYRREIPAQKNPLYLGMYIAMFPQLVAGPIVRYADIEDQITNRKETLRDFAAGARLFIIGLAKKVLLANIVAILAAKMLEAGGAEIGAAGAWAGLAAFTFQIFFDFAGYSDMAIGLGKMCGFQYARNFNYPYISKSITEFWRRWHISLSSFFRDYVYIPLGGSRCSKIRWAFNICVVWALTGFWHGAAWNFVLWGLLNLAFILAEKFIYGKALSKAPAIFQHLYSIFAFMMCWLLFWCEDMSKIGEYLLALFGGFGMTGASSMWELTAWQYVPIFIICVFASTPIIPWVRFKLTNWVKGTRPGKFTEIDLPNTKYLTTNLLCDYNAYITSDEVKTVNKAKYTAFRVVLLLADIALIALLYLSISSIIAGSFNPFIYFRF